MPNCFKCDKVMESAGKNQDVWDMPQGVVFSGGGNFGSTLYDRMMDGVYVKLLVCDDCLKEHKDKILECQGSKG